MWATLISTASGGGEKSTSALVTVRKIYCFMVGTEATLSGAYVTRGKWHHDVAWRNKLCSSSSPVLTRFSFMLFTSKHATLSSA